METTASQIRENTEILKRLSKLDEMEKLRLRKTYNVLKVSLINC